MNHLQVDRELASVPFPCDSPANDQTLSWYAVADDVKNILQLAAQNWENTSESEYFINQALAIASDNLDVLVSAYRYFFYKHNNSLALQIANKVIALIRASEQLPQDWEQLKPILLNRQDDPKIRLYLNAYAASGLILARLGEAETAKAVSARVKEIDSKKEFGGGIVWNILTQPPDEDE